MKVDLLNEKLKKDGQVELNDSIWTLEFNTDLVAQCVYVYSSNQRTGNANAKNRAQVRGGGRKPWKQKGTGRARSGSTRSPVWVGGGVTFSPTGRNWKKRLGKQMKLQGLGMSLSRRLKDGNVLVVKDVLKVDRNDIDKGVTVVSSDSDVVKRFRNVENASIISPSDINALDVVSARKLMIAENAVAKLEERFGNGE
jgi:large subunit ribosomal protein L4